MERVNDHLHDAHLHLAAATKLLEQEFARSYCMDVRNGRIMGLLDLHARLQEINRLAGAVQGLVKSEPARELP